MAIEVNDKSQYPIYRINLLTLQTEYTLLETDSVEESVSITGCAQQRIERGYLYPIKIRIIWQTIKFFMSLRK